MLFGHIEQKKSQDRAGQGWRKKLSQRPAVDDLALKHDPLNPAFAGMSGIDVDDTAPYSAAIGIGVA